MSAKDVALTAIRERKDEEGRTRDEARRHVEARYRQKVEVVLRQIRGPQAAGENYLESYFPGEEWQVVDLAPHMQSPVYGTCEIEVVIADETETFFLGVNLRCGGQHYWWVDPVTTASGPCYWRARDKGPGEDSNTEHGRGHGEVNPTPEMIGQWIEELDPRDRAPHLRERMRSFG